MKHDELCELLRDSFLGPTCHCGARAYAQNPYSEEVVPPPVTFDAEDEMLMTFWGWE